MTCKVPTRTWNWAFLKLHKAQVLFWCNWNSRRTKVEWLLWMVGWLMVNTEEVAIGHNLGFSISRSPRRYEKISDKNNFPQKMLCFLWIDFQRSAPPAVLPEPEPPHCELRGCKYSKTLIFNLRCRREMRKSSNFCHLRRFDSQNNAAFLLDCCIIKNSSWLIFSFN